MSLDDGMKALEPLMALRAVTDGEEQKSKIVVVVVVLISISSRLRRRRDFGPRLPLGLRFGHLLPLFLCSFFLFSCLILVSLFHLLIFAPRWLDR